MPYIGTRKHAAQAKDIAANGTNHPDWQVIGSGCFRTVFLHTPTEVCYKVNDSYTEKAYENSYEVITARLLLRRCKDNDQWINEYVRIPKVSGYTIDGEVIVAMEYIKGSLGVSVNPPLQALLALRSLGFQDMHGQNYIVDEAGTIWPVDLASPRKGSKFFDRADDRML